MNTALSHTSPRWIARILLAIVYIYVGIQHLRTPEFFMPIMPGWVPWPYEVILLTGVYEMIAAVGLLTNKWRYAAGIMLVAYAICVYPANIKHALDDTTLAGAHLGLGYHIPRLLFQPVFVWWALYAGGIISWPFKRR